jgi:transposase-like protein
MRRARGKEIAGLGGNIERVNEYAYTVRSQSRSGTIYDVVFSVDEHDWRCSCPDYFYRQVKCKHLWAVEYSRKIRQVVQPTVIEPIDIRSCLYCQSPQIVKDGVRHNKFGNIQKFKCRACGRYFTINLGFERMKHSPHGITTAMQLYFSGESLRNTAKSLRLIGVHVSHKTLYCWIRKYVGLMQNYLNQIKPQVSDTWRADEMFLKVKGNPKYLYALLDDETRYWIAREVAGDKMSREAPEYASRLFQQGKEVTGKKPLTLITEGLHAYHLAYRQEFYAHEKPVTKHVEHVTWRGEKGNEKMESFNGNTVRAREKTMRSLKREDTPILAGMQIFHNYVRPHMALGGETPSSRAGIKVEGENKWLTLIQTASLKRRSLDNTADH